VILRKVVMAAALFAFGRAVRMARRNLRRYEIAERSMEPALLPGDWVVAVPWRQPRRGDVVVVQHPYRPEFDLVKRVVGLPGETIVADPDGHVFLGGHGGLDGWGRGRTGPAKEWDVPSDCVFLLGDAREVSRDDSRTLGPIPVGGIDWQIRFRYWPRGRIGLI
jgi:signal peptidase I